VTGRRSKWVRRRKIDLAELVDEPWIVTPPNSEPWSLLAEAFSRKGIAVPSGTVVSTSIHIANRLTPTGRYLTIIPESVLRFGPMGSRMQVLPVDFPSAPRIAIVTLKNRMLNPAAGLFIETARRVARFADKPAR
jgi:DNA-binding transcriptional LysR family regulator